MRLHDVSKGMQGSDVNVLTKEQLAQLQLVLLMILDDINEICENNSLKYILIGGSAIGALRHQGFIPWDDDIDIAMTRSDYEKLADLIRSQYANKYSVSDARDTNNYGRLIPKIRLNGTEYRTVLETDLDDCGIRIDIFLIENTYDNALLRNIHGVLCMFFGFALSCKRLYDRRREFKSLSSSLSFKVKRILGALFSFASLNTWACWTDSVYSMCKDNTSKMISVPTDGAHFFGELTEREDLCESVPVTYENRTMRIPSAYEKYLSRIYGDYMKLPPKEKRLRSQYLVFDLGKYEGGNSNA